MRDDGVGANGGVVADGDSAKDRNAAANPDLFAKNDGLGGVAGVAQSFAFNARVIGVADAGVFADHAAFANADAGHGNQMHSAREHDIVAKCDDG